MVQRSFSLIALLGVTMLLNACNVTSPVLGADDPSLNMPARGFSNKFDTTTALVELSWTHVMGATNYRIDRQVDSGPYRELATVGRETRFTEEVLVPGTYRYRIRAMRGSAFGMPAETIVMVSSVQSVEIVPGAVYVGQLRQLTARPRDFMNQYLGKRSVTWWSSDPSVASIDAQGQVTGLSTGQTTIRATSEGKSGEMTLHVLKRPSTTWNPANDWTTHNGNARHTGFVNAVLDPANFEKLWSRTVLPNVRLHAVAVGLQQAFVVSDRSGEAQSLAAINLADGVTQWKYDFGSINAVNEPAFANGRVYVTTSGHADAFLYAFDARRGSIEYRAPYQTQWARYLAPIIENDTVYFAGGRFGGLYAFDQSDGRERWFTPTSQQEKWAPALHDGVLYTYLGSQHPKLFAVNADDGQDLFNIPDVGAQWSPGNLQMAPSVGSTNNVFVTGDYRLVAFDLTKKAVGWAANGNYFGTVTVGSGSVFVAKDFGIEARDEQDGRLRWSWRSPDEAAVTSIVASKNILLVATSNVTYAVDIAAHATVWSHPEGGRLSLSSQGVLLIAQANGKLTSIRVK